MLALSLEMEIFPAEDRSCRPSKSSPGPLAFHGGLYSLSLKSALHTTEAPGTQDPQTERASSRLVYQKVSEELGQGHSENLRGGSSGLPKMQRADAGQRLTESRGPVASWPSLSVPLLLAKLPGNS